MQHHSAFPVATTAGHLAVLGYKVATQEGYLQQQLDSVLEVAAQLELMSGQERVQALMHLGASWMLGRYTHKFGGAKARLAIIFACYVFF